MSKVWEGEAGTMKRFFQIVGFPVRVALALPVLTLLGLVLLVHPNGLDNEKWVDWKQWIMGTLK